ncbi:GTPase IMAP family member 9-like [Mercenaria mercenaria]|uniref:GTPase IMAP family member 9-like n=1 Tax=Mercenaria mercenaria TaxID=6596 RepID=UPI00234ED92C|nr:GTPase IMAP family member 9-like [Mercenaria mercenaria]
MDEIKRSIDICPEPHAFLIVFNPNYFMTEDEEFTIDLLELTFGENLFDHCIVLFTHGDSFRNEKKFRKWVWKSNMLSQLVNRCGGRIARIENDSNGKSDMNSLYGQLEILCESRKKQYLPINSDALHRSLGNKQIQWNSAEERRIILIGKTGNGKSSTGNSLLGRHAFDEEMDLCSITQTCSMRKRFDKKRNMTYIVVDTPGLMDTDVDLITRMLEVQKSVYICPGPHAFLLVFSSKNRMTEDEKYTIDHLRILFGEKMFDHCIIVFTNGSEFKTDEHFKQFWEKSPIISPLAEKCGRRILRIENKDLANIWDDVFVKGVYEQIAKFGQNIYQYKLLKNHTEVLNLHKENYKGDRKIESQLSSLVVELDKKIRDQLIWRAVLVGSTVVVVGLGGAGVASTAAAAALASGAARITAVSAATAGAGVASALIAKFKFW